MYVRFNVFQASLFITDLKFSVLPESANLLLSEERDRTIKNPLWMLMYLARNLLIGNTIFYVSYWRRDRHLTRSFEPREGLAGQKQWPYFSIGLRPPWVKPLISRWLQLSALPTELVLQKLKKWLPHYIATSLIPRHVYDKGFPKTTSTAVNECQKRRHLHRNSKKPLSFVVHLFIHGVIYMTPFFACLEIQTGELHTFTVV